MTTTTPLRLCMRAAEANALTSRTVCPVQVTSDSYEPAGGSVNGSGFRLFDVVIPFSFRTGEVTGEEAPPDVLPPFISEANGKRWPCEGTCLTCVSSPPGEVFMPSGESAQPAITDNLDGTVTVQFSPTEAGLHEMHIKYDGAHIPGQPAGARARAATELVAGPRLQTVKVLDGC